MARGDDVRALGKKLDAIHTRLCDAKRGVQKQINELDGVLADRIIGALQALVSDFDSANDDVQSVYNELDEEADLLDEQEKEETEGGNA
jgi:hypothetical protein